MAIQKLDLKPYQLTRPEKIYWLYPQSTDLLGEIKSKSLRKYLSNADESMRNNNLRIEYKTLSEDEYKEWLIFYDEKMTEHGYDHLANLDWYHRKMEAQQKVEGVFLYQSDKLVGTGIFIRWAEDGKEKATFAYKASERVELPEKNSSIGALLDYFYLKTMIDQKVDVISAGHSRNNFGVINTLGYLDYKLSFGYHPFPGIKNSQTFETVMTMENGIALFFGIKENEMKLYMMKPLGFHFEFGNALFPKILPITEIEY
jgi:hypothetical protein